ncbi:MAG: ribosome biogenesis GTP-binding protein YihA/YsxC [Clostridiales bacterium]|nr:ribosome biogenesis GTP-binding protein YihA/YsxC [Clostridiales bacterium]
MNLHNTEFKKSAVSQNDFPVDGLPQIVFAGRSNVGKSSIINKLLNRKNFARVGESPGKTVHINLFLIDKKVYFVDLPGYGFAKVSKAEKDRWGALIEQFFGFGTISLGILIVDIRHKPTQDDVIMAKWFMETGVPFIVAANKSDKCKKSEIESLLEQIRTTLKLTSYVKLIPFSSVSGEGRDELLYEINHLGETT